MMIKVIDVKGKERYINAAYVRSVTPKGAEKCDIDFGQWSGAVRVNQPAEQVAEVLNTVELMRVAPELYQLKERGFLHEPLVGPPLEVAFKGNQLRMTGGEDRTGGDGIGYFFDVHAVLVPEPSGALLAAIGLGVVYARRRRNATSRMTRAAS